jgi:hypothetical protein
MRINVYATEVKNVFCPKKYAVNYNPVLIFAQGHFVNLLEPSPHKVMEM